MHKAYADGACRPSPGWGAYGFIIYDGKERIVKFGNGSVGRNTTNSVAEYTAIIKAMEAALRVGVKRLTVYTDSQAAIRQITCNHSIYNWELQRLKLRIDSIQKKFKEIHFVFIPRFKNRVADAIAAEFYRTAGSISELKKIC